MKTLTVIAEFDLPAQMLEPPTLPEHARRTALAHRYSTYRKPRYGAGSERGFCRSLYRLAASRSGTLKTLRSC